MKAVVVHHNLNAVGGEATVAIETIRALRDLGYDVELVTVLKPNAEVITKAYGNKIPIEKVKSIFPFKMEYFGIYQRLLTIIPRLSIRDSDVIINTHGNTLPYLIPNYTRCILFVFFPTWLRDYEVYENKYRRSLFWNAYFKPYRVMSNMLMKRTLSRSNLILTSSKFSRDVLKKAYPHVNSYVLYPAVDIDRFSLAYKSNSRVRQVLIIARLSAEKQIEKVIKIARLLNGIKFKVIGSLIPANRRYFESLQRMIQENRLEGVIKLVPNATHEELVAAMSESMVYLHTMYGEHFGISIVEAMGAGLLPIVPSYGGCSEIVPPEYQYNTLEEAAYFICRNIDNYDSEKRKQVYSIARQFSPSIFRQRMQQYIERICNNSHSNRTS